MKTTVSKHHFIDAFMKSSYCDNFSYDGLGMLFDYLEKLEEDCEAELEFDLVAIACDYAESSVPSIAQEYRIEGIDDSMADEEIVETVREYLEYNTQICGEYEEEGVTYFIYCSSF